MSIATSLHSNKSSSSSSSSTLESNQITKPIRKLSIIRQKLEVLIKFMKSHNEGPDKPVTSTSTCRSFSSKEVALEEPRSVRFGCVEIREYGRVLIEHPECRDGLGLGMDWKHSRKVTRLSVDCFERIQRQKGKRKSRTKQLCTYNKKVLLRDIGGYSETVLWEVFCTKFKGDKSKIENLASS
jgi:hypothetical protein